MRKSHAMLIIIAIIMMFCNMAFASTTVSPPVIGGETDQEAMGIATEILGYIQFLAFAVAVGMVLVIGSKYMLSGANGMAKAKDTLVPYIIGAVIAGSASAITRLVISMIGG